MKLEIEQVTNGYVIKYDDELDDGTVVKKRNVVADSNNLEFDDDQVEKQSFLNLVYEIQELFGVFTSKHNSVNIEYELINKDGEKLDRDTLEVVKE